MQPLSQHRIFASDQVDEIRHSLNSFYNESAIRIGPTKGQRVLSHELFAVPLGGIMLTSLTWPRGCDADAPCLDDTFDFCTPCRGTAEITVGNETVIFDQDCGVVLSPKRPMCVQAGNDNVHLNIKVPRPLIEAQLRALTGRELDEPLEFEPAFQYTREPLAGLWRFVRFVAAEIDRDDSFLSNRLVGERYSEALLTGLLYAQPNTYSKWLHYSPDAIEPRYVRLVEEYLEAHCHRPHSARDLTAVAGVSASALYAAFRQHRGYTPSEFLKNVRLRRVRDELIKFSPATTTVREVASRWGFNHVGRFSQEYRQRYGESPSETLRG